MSVHDQMSGLNWKVDECSVYFDRLHIRGWCFHSIAPIIQVEALFPEPKSVVPLTSFGLESADVAVAVDSLATHCRFDEWLFLPSESLGRDFKLRFTLQDNILIESGSVIENASKDDPYFRCWDHFIDQLGLVNSGTVLEIGSRARSAITYRDFIPKKLEYVGMDILPGPNVDVVGDAHELEKIFGTQQFVAAFSRSVFEHLAMPWKVAIELNRILVPGGIVFTGTHQSWPVHERPWDFWRFSEYSWQTIFNADTGFRVLEAASGEPARIHALRANPATRDLPVFPAYLGSASIVQKVNETTLEWPVLLNKAAQESYPKGELSRPPS
jgi:SAM-dependent methyltransferase